jgi:ATP-dependent Clp protease ATP-binding subunit ClpA
MFERYTGLARECVFRARSEAARSGSSFIETEHLLLGVFESDRGLADLLLGSAEAIAAIRAQAGVPEPSAPENPAKDLQLSHESKRVLAYGAEEGERMGARHIGTEHLVLGLLREQDCRAAQILRDRGLEMAAVREKFVRLTRTATRISETDPHRIVSEPPTSHSDAAPHELRALFSTTSRYTGIFGSLTEKARRSIFFARYEASQVGSMSIETEHLLLGLLREDQTLARRLLPDSRKDRGNPH